MCTRIVKSESNFNFKLFHMNNYLECFHAKTRCVRVTLVELELRQLINKEKKV